jgi:hypothetical protein
MAIKQYPFKVIAPNLGQSQKFTVTVRINVPTPEDAKSVLDYIHGAQLKTDFMNSWMRENTPGYGVEVRGGPRPVFEKPDDRQSQVLAYEQDFRVSRAI